MIIRGKYYDGKNAGSRDIQVNLGADGLLSAVPGGFESVHVREISISSRIGNTPRHLGLPSGAMIETVDHEHLDQWLASQGYKPGWAHRLESNLRLAVGALAGTAIILTGFAIWGIPWLSTRAAYALPPEINNYIGQGALETLDKRVFRETGLDETRRRQLTARFSELIPADDDAIHYRLLFRGGGLIGANAFALPDGTVVMTDELADLARHDDEILSVLLHEIGHVVHRHSLRQVISHSGLLALTSVITGDVSSAGALVLAMPNVLLETSYTRELETEADTYVLEHLREFGIEPARFAEFMERLERCGMVLRRQTEGHESGAQTDMSDCEAELQTGDRADETPYNWSNYISTHPPSAERIARFRNAR